MNEALKCPSTATDPSLASENWNPTDEMDEDPNDISITAAELLPSGSSGQVLKFVAELALFSARRAKLVANGYDLSGIAGFFLNEQNHWSIYCPDAGYFVPICNWDGYIVSMQICLNKPTTDKDKYRFFSSSRDSL